MLHRRRAELKGTTFEQRLTGKKGVAGGGGDPCKER